MEFSTEFILISTILFLIFLSGFFSTSETALTALSRAKIHKLVKKGNKKALRVEKLRLEKDRLIGDILIGNNLVNVLASTLATKMLIDIYGDKGVAFASIVMTIMIVIFAEILPKTYALYNAEKVSLSVSGLLKFIFKILTPLSFFIRLCTNAIFKIFGIEKFAKKNDLITAIEELRGTIELHKKEGGILKEDKDMLDSILDLAETDVSSVMTHRKNMFTINARNSSKEIVEAISTSPYTRIPLWQNEPDNIIGIIHGKDVFKTTLHSTKNISEINLLKIAAKPWFIPEGTTLREQLIAFKRERSHFAIVVDEYGSVMGIITLEDILEEIVGEIKDEHDKGAISSYKKINDTSFFVDGDATVRDINRELDLELPDEEASTMAGLLISQCETIPNRGENFEFHGFKFYVVEKHKNQITKLKLVKIADELEEK